MRPADPTDDVAIREAILDSLEWNEEFEIDRLGVKVDAGVASVSGRVPGQSERVATEEVVSRIRGVRFVVNNLAVEDASGSHGHAA